MAHGALRLIHWKAPGMIMRRIAAIRDWIRAQSAAYHEEVGAPSSGHGGSGGRWLVSYAD